MLRVATERIRLEYEESAGVEKTATEVHLRGQNGAGWQCTLTSTITATPILLLPPGGKSLLIGYGLNLYALNARTGEIRWQRHFSEPIWAGQLLADGRLLFHLELSVVCLDVAGEECWRYAHDEIITEVAVQDNQVIGRDFTGRHPALNLKPGLLQADR